MLTVVPATKFVPTIVISVPPNVLPVCGAIDEIPIPDGPVAPPPHEVNIANQRKTASLVKAEHRTTKL
jgi:hypothetical protein